MGETDGPQRILICGAGPVGALAALYAAKRGDDVHVYEMRDDIRTVATAPAGLTKSINLALAERGLNAMRHADSTELLESVLKDTVPMHSRMIHGRGKDGQEFQESQAYDTHGRYNQAVDRAGLNKRMLDVLEGLPNVTLHFNHKLTGANFAQNIAWFEQRSPGQKITAENRPKEIEVHFDLVIGADGAHSATRFHLMKYANLFYQQEYIDKLWSEFHIRPTTEDGGFAIDPNHLHIWPADSVMFIAIPSSDGSFTCTLFASPHHFASLSKDPATSVPAFFDQHFPGVTPALIPPHDLIDQFEQNAHLPLISIKCAPHHYGSSVVIVGDAAHAMVPFYGQGMNAGLEDVRVLFEKLDSHGVYSPSLLPPTPSNSNSSVSSSSSSTGPGWGPGKHRSQRRARALAAYTAQRVPDAHAINDLALNNYREMSSHVSSPAYKVRKWMEETVSVWMPWTGWRTQYTRVSFENQRYSDVIREVRRQGRILAGVMGVVAVGVLGVGLVGFGRSAGRIPFMRHVLGGYVK